LKKIGIEGAAQAPSSCDDLWEGAENGTMNGVTELGYLVLGVKDMPRWRTFAGEFLGLEVVDGETSTESFLRMDFWHHRIILEEDPVDDVTALGLRVADNDAFEMMARRLSEEGVPHRICSHDEAQKRRVLRLMTLADPNGHPIEIFHGPSSSQNVWTVRDGQRRSGALSDGGRQYSGVPALLSDARNAR
jgi:extradiol dioxygenase family protein